jgi:N-acetylglucosaminyldiphosphoundecaprenol N-acetyl-beta-D-mannosaminyltransferase
MDGGDDQNHNAATSVEVLAEVSVRVLHSEKKVPRMSIGHVGIDAYSESDLIDEVLQHALHGGSTRQIVTVNAQFYVLAESSRPFRECLKGADYICADGMPIVWTCAMFVGRRVPRIAGVDLIENLCRRGAARGLRVFLLGGRPGTASTTAHNLSQRFPGIKIAGVSCPEFGFETSEATLNPVLAQIAQAKPHILFVGLGTPKQEFFIDKHVRPLNVPIAIGIGGSFEILSGSLERAPKWMQSAGLEWSFRLGQEPQRLCKRYLVGNTRFLWSVIKWRLRT